MGFNQDEISQIVSIFYILFISKNSSDKIFQIINSFNLDENKKNVLKNTVKNIHDKTDSKFVSERLFTHFLQTFGSLHIHDIKTMIEFSSMFENNQNKIQHSHMETWFKNDENTCLTDNDVSVDKTKSTKKYNVGTPLDDD